MSSGVSDRSPVVGSSRPGMCHFRNFCLSELKKKWVFLSPSSCQRTPALSAMPSSFSLVNMSSISSHLGSASSASFFSASVDELLSAIPLSRRRSASYCSLSSFLLAVEAMLAEIQYCLIFFLTRSHCSCLLSPWKHVCSW